nr:MAG TPA: hypothetical protein [Caudoviricetes sp.]
MTYHYFHITSSFHLSGLNRTFLDTVPMIFTGR